LAQEEAVDDGATRTEASKIGGVGLQFIRDWCSRRSGRRRQRAALVGAARQFGWGDTALPHQQAGITRPLISTIPATPRLELPPTGSTSRLERWFADGAKAANPRSISPASLTLTGTMSMPGDGATAWMAPNSDFSLGTQEAQQLALLLIEVGLSLLPVWTSSAAMTHRSASSIEDQAMVVQQPAG
jgi:hypothetical protein